MVSIIKTNLSIAATSSLLQWKNYRPDIQKEKSRHQRSVSAHYLRNKKLRKGIKALVEKTSLEVEQMALYRWHFKADEYELVKKSLTTAINKSERVQNGMAARLLFDRWKKYTFSLSFKRLQKIKEVLKGTLMRYYYTDDKVFHLWKAETFQTVY